MANNPVLNSTRFLIENPEHVRINEERLADLTNELRGEKFFVLPWDFPEYIGKARDDEVIDYYMVCNSLNFAFNDFEGRGKWKAEINGQEFPGSQGMWASLRNAFEEGKDILNGEYLANISEDEVRGIFQGNFEIPMFDERLEVLREVGEVLSAKYGGHFYNLVEASGNKLFNNGDGLVERLVRDFPPFDDSCEYGGKKVVLNKRAQLAPAMLYGRFQGADVCQFEDMEELTVFADYVLPTGYHNEGVFEYSDFLTECLEEQIPVEAGSRPELEFRAQTVHVSDRISKELGVPSFSFDTKMWGRTRKIPDLKYFLVKTINY